MRQRNCNLPGLTPASSSPTTDPAALRDAVAAASWYHTIDLPDGTRTPGEYDLKATLARIPFPADLTGRRCLDVGTRDGFWAFEMERRGAAEVVAIDVGDVADLDWPQPPRPLDAETRAELDRRGRAFETARGLLGSGVRRELVSVYDLSSETLGSFDFVFLGTLLLHLRDPVGALTAVAGVTRGHLLLNEPISVSLSALRRRSPTAALHTGADPFWWLPNTAALRRYLDAAGFAVEAQGQPYLIRNSPHLDLASARQLRTLVNLRRHLLLRIGAPHAWLVARPV